MDDGVLNRKNLRKLSQAPILPLPNSIAITPDSPEEGKVIWTLLKPII